jgi:TrmH family RNA methyltransferase
MEQVERITSRQNAVVKRFRALARTGPSADGEILLDGEHLIDEALAVRLPIAVAAFSQTGLNGSTGRFAEIARRAGHAGARILSVPDDVLSAMSPVRQPSGAVAIARVQAAALRSVFRPASRTPLVLVLAGVQDPGNVGAIIRSAAAFDATAIVTTEDSANPFGWKALRGAMGGTFRLPVSTGAAIDDVVTACREAEIPLAATVPRGGTPLPEADLRCGCAIVLGGEGAGVPDTALRAAGTRVTIPMRESAESLNVATAAALVLYEAWRQRSERR